jgi:hypothetical protein
MSKSYLRSTFYHPQDDESLSGEQAPGDPFSGELPEPLSALPMKVIGCFFLRLLLVNLRTH